jgi:hypothetical protein
MKKYFLFLFLAAVSGCQSFYAANAVSDGIVVRLFVDAMKAEDLIRGYYKGGDILIDGMPYLQMHPSVNTFKKLEAFLETIYTKEAAQRYIQHLDVAEIDKKNHRIGRAALYFYNRNYDFCTDNKKAVLVESRNNDRVYILAVTFTETGRSDELYNFRIRMVENRWKVDVMPDEMRGK